MATSSAEQRARTALGVELDLLSSPALVAQIAAAWATIGANGRLMSRTTAAQRLTRVAAFYSWAHRNGWDPRTVGSGGPVTPHGLSVSPREEFPASPCP